LPATSSASKHASGEDGGDLLAALVRGHRGRVGERLFNCGLLAEAPTTACPSGPGSLSGRVVLLVY